MSISRGPLYSFCENCDNSSLREETKTVTKIGGRGIFAIYFSFFDFTRMESDMKNMQIVKSRNKSRYVNSNDMGGRE